MGNECGYGCTFEEALKWTKEFDPSRLTCYESALYKSDRRRYDYSNIDLYSRMYPELEEIEEYMEKGPDKPFLLIEYCHAMGNVPGFGRLFSDDLQVSVSLRWICMGNGVIMQSIKGSGKTEKQCIFMARS